MGWLRNIFGGRGAPAAGAAQDRYAGRPLLVLLDNYVVSAVSPLPPEKQASLQQITQQVFGGGEDWRATLRETLQLGDELDGDLRVMWETHREGARAAGLVLSAEEFAIRVVDENFAHLLPQP